MKQSRFCRILIVALICSLTLPMAGYAASQNADGSAVVHARLNSAERQAAIARAAEMDKAAREAFAAQEAGAMQPSATVTPVRTSDGVRAENSGATERKTSLYSSSSSRPKTITEVMFNAATGVVGLPGLAGTQSNDPYNPNADQGLGFHADGTARRADGTTGTNAASAGYNGKRAAAYAGQGLGYSPYANGQYGYQEPGYDPVTGQNFRYGDPTNGGRRTMGQGGYGNPHSVIQFDPNRMLMQRGLNYGMGLANSAAEGLFLGLMESPYGGAKARFNFMVDWDGRVNGEGDLLLPWWDSKYTTVYTQLGARSMSGASSGGEDGRGADRWIGNFGLGQRWYPLAVNDGTDKDAGNLMLGYNAFFDNDFTRSHQRGGVGIEGQYDWLHLASNYYFPLSSWKGSEDFDSNFVKERPAEGWDIRAKGYLPFYRNVALTGAYTQWYGDNVGMFGAKNLEKDPKIWSYGLEYTPVPLVSGFVNQRQSEQGRSDTEFGLRFTYHFQMPWEDQIRHDKVAQLRTVGGSRHEFVDRENRIILEYKAKNNFHVEYLGTVGTNQFKFRIRNGFDKYVAGQQVRVSASGGATLAEAAAPAPTTFLAQAGEFLGGLFSVKAAHAADFSQTYTTDGNGEFIVRLDNVLSIPVVLTIQAGNSSQSVTLHEATVTGGLSAAMSTLANSASTTLTFTGPANTAVAWTLVSGPGTLSGQQNTTNASGVATALLTGNASGFGLIEVKATVNSNDYTATVTIDKTLSLTADSANPAVNTGETKTLKFMVRQNGVAMPNSAVTLSASGPGTLSTTSVTTNGSGEFSVDLTGSAVGTVTITATVASAGSAPATVAVGAATVLTLTPDNSAQTFPIGTTRSNESFTLKDNGTPLASGVSVALAYAGPGAFDNAPATANTASGGKIALNLKGLTAGNVTITATANGKSATSMLTVTAATVLSLTADAANPVVNTGETKTLKFMVRQNGVAMPNSAVTLSASGPGTLSTTSVTTNGSGEFSVDLTGSAVGTVTITATVASAGSAPATVAVGAATVLTLTPDNSAQTFPIGTTRSNESFTLKDNGTPLASGVSVALAYAGPGAFDNAPATANTASGGKIALNLKGLTAGNVTITATANGKSATSMLTVTAATVLTLTQDSPQNFPAGATVNNVAFTLTDGGQPVQNASLTLAWSNTGGAFNAPPANASTDGSGKFTLASLTGQTAGNVTLTATLPGPDNRTVTCPLTVVVAPYVLSFDQPGGYSPSFSGSGSSNKASQMVVITVRQNGSPVDAGVTVSLTPSMNDAANQAIVSSRRNQYYGLTVNSVLPGGANFPNLPPLTTNGSGQVTLTLTDIVGERTLSLTASATPPGGSPATASASVAFGAGPLAKFKAPLSGTYPWSTDPPVTGGTSNFPAAQACGGTVSYTGDGYYASSKLPQKSDLQAVADNSAWQAAGWPEGGYWTGEVHVGGLSAFLVQGSGTGISVPVTFVEMVVCLRD